MNLEIERALSRLVMIATVKETDAAKRRLKVVYGDEQAESGWVPWPAEYGRNFTRWKPVRTGAQVVLLSPGGDLSRAVIVGQLYTSDITPPADTDTLDVVEYEDGTRIEYDSEAKALSIDCAGAVTIASAGDAEVTAKGSASVTARGDAAITGATVTLNGGDAGGVVCQSHLCAFTNAAHPQASVTVTGGN